MSRQSNEEVQVKRAVSRPYMEVKPIHESGTELSVITRYDPYEKNWLKPVNKPWTLNKHSMTCVFKWSKWVGSTFCSLKQLSEPYRLLWLVPWTGFWGEAEPCSPPAWFRGSSGSSDTPWKRRKKLLSHIIFLASFISCQIAPVKSLLRSHLQWGLRHHDAKQYIS